MNYIDIIYNKIDKKVSKLKPNYGYIEKYMISEKILKINNYLLPKDDEILELLNLVIDYG